MKRAKPFYRCPLTFELALLGTFGACLLFGSDYGKQYVQISKTRRLDSPAGGALRLVHSTGKVTIEGWDEPGVELTTTIQSLAGFVAADRDKERKELERVRVEATRSGNELMIATSYPHHRAFPYFEPLSVVTDFNMQYRIKVPRNANLAIQHDDGEVNIDGIAGNVQAKVRQGLIELRIVAESVPPMIDAKSFVGTVNSDFDGTEKGQPLHFGHTFTEGAASAPQKLDLKIRYGDVVILKAHEPKEPPPST
jgi:hypothetical protein